MLIGNIVSDNKVAALRSALSNRFRARVASLCGKTNNELVLAAIYDEGAKHIRVFDELKHRRAIRLLMLSRQRLSDTVVGGRSGHDDQIRSLGDGARCIQKVIRRRNINAIDTGRHRDNTRSANDIYSGSKVNSRLRKRSTHFARACIADETHGIDRLTGSTGRNQHALAVEG